MNSGISKTQKEETFTKKELIEVLVWDILVNQQALRAFDATTQELHKVLVLNPTYQVDFIEELIYPLPSIVKQSLNCNGFPIWKCPFEHRTCSPLAYFPWRIKVICCLLECFVFEVQAAFVEWSWNLTEIVAVCTNARKNKCIMSHTIVQKHIIATSFHFSCFFCAVCLLEWIITKMSSSSQNLENFLSQSMKNIWKQFGWRLDGLVDLSPGILLFCFRKGYLLGDNIINMCSNFWKTFSAKIRITKENDESSGFCK